MKRCGPAGTAVKWSMSGPEQFSVTTAVLLVLGGVAAVVLAIAVAFGGSSKKAPVPASISAEPAVSASPDGTEFPLDTAEP